MAHRKTCIAYNSRAYIDTNMCIGAMPPVNDKEQFASVLFVLATLIKGVVNNHR